MNGNTLDLLIELKDIAMRARTGLFLELMMVLIMAVSTGYLYDIRKALDKLADNKPKK